MGESQPTDRWLKNKDKWPRQTYIWTSKEMQTMQQKIEAVTQWFMDWENFWPIMWDYLHWYTFIWGVYLTPHEMNKFLNEFAESIPCEECKEHFLAHLKANPFTHNDFIKFCWPVKYTIKIHNLVNKDLDKVQFSFEDYINKNYDKLKRTDNKKPVIL